MTTRQVLRDALTEAGWTIAPRHGPDGGWSCDSPSGSVALYVSDTYVALWAADEDGELDDELEKFPTSGPFIPDVVVLAACLAAEAEATGDPT